MHESFSRAMKEARESRGISREELARRARVPLLVVRNLEEGRWSQLPEEVYLRWFLERLAKTLDLPPSLWHPLVEELNPRVDLSSVTVKRTGGSGSWGWRKRVAMALSILVVLGGLLLLTTGKGFFSRGGHGDLGKKFGELSSLARQEKTRMESGVSALSSMAKSKTEEAEAALVSIHHLEIRAKGPCWVRMRLENGAIRDFILKPGEKYDASFTKNLEVRLGNPGAVEIVMDGKPLSLGEDLGRPKTLRISPNGLREVPGGKRDL